MDIPDHILLKLTRINPTAVPIVKIGRCLSLLDGDDRQSMLATITRRKPKTDVERKALLGLALNHRLGGVLFIDALGGFDGQLAC